MRKYKTLDGYQVYLIKKENKFCFLADRLHYKKEITKLLDTLDDLKFDSVIFIFGMDTGEYLEALKKVLCVQNKVFIFEPNKEIYNKYVSALADNIQLVFFEENQVTQIFGNTINFRNINNVYFHAFGNYKDVYQQEYDCLIKHLDWTLINQASPVVLSKRFKKINIQNMIANLKVINQCTPIHKYAATKLNVPAIVVSGGPSLDQNIAEMLKYKEKLKQCFIITGSRTVDALIKNDIMPDMIVSVDPVDANFEMMKDYLDLDVPLAFYEYSNRYLVRDYKGDKIFISLLLSRTLEAFSHWKGVYCGGSIAHACIDIANSLGCTPILLAGQDFAHTNQKYHADCASFHFDNNLDKDQMLVKDVNGNDIGTTVTLDFFKRKLEKYIVIFQQKQIEFINCSYGAAIEGAPHRKLDEVLERLAIQVPKQSSIPDRELSFNTKETIDTIFNFLNDYLVKAGQGLELCEKIIQENQTKSLVEVEEEDIDLQRMLFILEIAKEFENNRKSEFLDGYFTLFVVEMKECIFNMQAKDYESLTSDLQYQARAFQVYFKKLEEMLTEVLNIAKETVSEFYDLHIV